MDYKYSTIWWNLASNGHPLKKKATTLLSWPLFFNQASLAREPSRELSRAALACLFACIPNGELFCRLGRFSKDNTTTVTMACVDLLQKPA